MPTGRPNVYRIASVAITLVFMTAVGWTYLNIRASDHHLPLILHTQSNESGWLTRQMAVFELRRRTKNGDFDGVMVLSDLVTVAFTGPAVRDLALGDAEDLAQSTINVNSHSKSGYTAIHLSIGSNNADVLRWLLSHGADPMITTDLGFDQSQNLDAYQYLRFLESQFPDVDRSEVTEVLYQGDLKK